MNNNIICVAKKCNRSLTCGHKSEQYNDKQHIVKINPLLANGSCNEFLENDDWNEKRIDVIGQNGNVGYD